MIGRAAVVVVVALAWAAPALSCRSFGPSLASVDVGAAAAEGGAVPTNAFWLGPPVAIDRSRTWWVRRVVDSEYAPMIVTFDDDFTRVFPREELEPNRAYEALLATADAPPSPDVAHAGAVGFRTGPGADVDAPAVPRLRELRFDGLLEPSPCRPPALETHHYVELVVEPDAGVAGYRLERVDGVGDITLVGAFFPPEPVVDFHGPAVFGVHLYRLTALDHAGNASTLTTSVDLGPAPLVDDSIAWGCSSTTTAAPLSLLALALLRRRRRWR